MRGETRASTSKGANGAIPNGPAVLPRRGAQGSQCPTPKLPPIQSARNPMLTSWMRCAPEMISSPRIKISNELV